MLKPKITPRFARRKALLTICCALSLAAAGCGGPDANLAAGVAAVVAVPDSAPAAARPAAIQKKLAPICPTPTQWTLEQRRLVGSYMLTQQAAPGMQLLAPEWQRLNDGATICRHSPQDTK